MAQGQTDASGQSSRIQGEQAFRPHEVWVGASGWSFAVESEGLEPPSPLDEQRYELDDEDSSDMMEAP